MRRAGRTSEKIRTHHLAQARLQKTRRVSTAVRFHRARKDVKSRINPRLEKAINDNAAYFTISCAQMAPYVQKFGKPSVTVFIRECLPPYFGVKAKSTRDGDRFNGWMVTRIG